MLRWLLHYTGSDNVSGTWYGFWSGFGGDLTLFGGLLAFMRHRNCEVHGCWRLARHTTSSGHRVCKVHNPKGRVLIEDLVEKVKNAT